MNTRTLSFEVWLLKLGIWVLGFGIFLAACAAPTLSPTPDNSAPTEVQVAVATGDILPGSPRLPLVLFDGPHPITDAQSVQVTVFDLATPSAPRAGWSGPATAYADYEIPYWVAYPQLPRAGRWGLNLQITKADGSSTQAQLTVQVVEKVDSPNVGDTPPASHNRTLATEPDIAKLTSDISPEPGLYQLTVADALTSGKPTVVTFATPAFCTSRLCAPVVDSVKAVYADLKDSVNFIHIEVYKDFGPPPVYADEMDEWRLQSEPWTFVMDRAGKVVARLGGPVSPAELRSVLEPLVK